MIVFLSNVYGVCSLCSIAVFDIGNSDGSIVLPGDLEEEMFLLLIVQLPARTPEHCAPSFLLQLFHGSHMQLNVFCSDLREVYKS